MSSVQLLRDGRIYHTSINDDGSTREHFHNGAVRDNGKSYVLDCVECDSITTVPKATANAHFREIDAQVKAGRKCKQVDANAMLDAFAFAREDGATDIPLSIPQDTAGRRALCAHLRLLRHQLQG